MIHVRSVVIAVLLAAAVLAVGFCSFRDDQNSAEFYLSIEGSSMAPTITSGTSLKVVKDGGVTHGSIVAYRYPADTTRTFIGRVVAMPNEWVEVANGTLLVNGATYDLVDYPLGYAVSPVQLRDNEVFILGDNRNDSFDSHVFGPVWLGYVRGVVAE